MTTRHEARWDIERDSKMLLDTIARAEARDGHSTDARLGFISTVTVTVLLLLVVGVLI